MESADKKVSIIIAPAEKKRGVDSIIPMPGAEFRKRDLPIGRGSVESACKKPVKARMGMKSGMDTMSVGPVSSSGKEYLTP